MKTIPLIKPYITDEVKQKVLEVLDSGYLTEGSVTKQFEDCVRDYIGCSYAIAVSNCTVGLELALRALKLGPGDEVIVPDYTFPSTATVVNIVGASIVLVDVDPKTMLIDYDAIEKAITPKTKAILPVSLFGNPLDYDRLWRIKQKYDVYIVEDAACAIGASYDAKYAGDLADITVFSFHPRKFITTGEGGMVTTGNRQWAEWLRSYKLFGRAETASRRYMHFKQIGTNCKLSNVHAAIGLVQIQQIEKLLNNRAAIVNRYHDLLADQANIRFTETTPKGVHSWQSYCIFVDNRDQIIEQLKKRNIEAHIGTFALHLHDAYRENSRCMISGQMLGSQYAFEHCLALPLYHELKVEEQRYVATEIVKSLEQII